MYGVVVQLVGLTSVGTVYGRSVRRGVRRVSAVLGGVALTYGGGDSRMRESHNSKRLLEEPLWRVLKDPIASGIYAVMPRRCLSAYIY